MNYYNPTSYTKCPSLWSRLFRSEDTTYYFTSDNKLEWKSKGQRKAEKELAEYKTKRNNKCNRNLYNDYYIIVNKSWYPKTQTYILF